MVPMVPMVVWAADGCPGRSYGSYVRSCFGRGAACATPSPLKQNGSIPDFKVKEVFL